MSLTEGRPLGRYAIESSLGARGRGEVYRARDTRLGRTLAIKVIRSHSRVSQEFQERLAREVRAMLTRKDFADVVLLDRNRLDDITNMQRIHAVVVSGRYLARAELDRVQHRVA